MVQIQSAYPLNVVSCIGVDHIGIYIKKKNEMKWNEMKYEIKYEMKWNMK